MRSREFGLISVILLTGASASMGQTPANVASTGAGVAVPRAEFLATMDSQFHAMDADRNGILTRKEIEQGQRAASARAVEEERKALFARLDTDNNGALSPAEFAKLPIDAPKTDPSPVLVQDDLNHDGSITLVEYRTAKLANFDRMDTDKDGVVSIAEMKAAGLIK